MAKTIQIRLAESSCKAGLGYARKHLSAGPPKDAVICCEGMCLKGETARRAANLIAHDLVPGKAVRICHGGLLEETGGMRELVRRAGRVLILDGCGMACGTRLTEGAFPDLEPQVVFANQLYECDQDIFGVDEMPDSQINANAAKVAQQVVEKYF
ncbi:MAG: putative zinc-binding protein [Desulfobacteraceae bacterium]|nr:putative zinc-binding protein [Desulfobacteraceae bacterium]